MKDFFFSQLHMKLKLLMKRIHVLLNEDTYIKNKEKKILSKCLE